MRVDRLDLTAFGPFTDMTLDLSAPGIHVIAGPNEAGKSTALHAFDQLLYGLDVRSPYDFVHAKGALRLGALIRGGDGTALEIVRTKSRKTPLLGADGAVLDQAALNTILGGIDRSTFTSVFALSSAELRKGGETLAHGGGDFGHALAATRSGGRLTDALRAIDERMEALYKRRGTLPQIKMHLTELKQAKETMRAAALRPQEYLDREREVKTAEETLRELTEELSQARTEHSRLDRLIRALPALNRRRELLADIAGMDEEGAPVAAEVVERLPGLREDLRLAESRLADARRRLDEITRELDGLTVDDDLLSCEESIDSLYQDRKAALQAAKQLAKSSSAVVDLRAEALSLLVQVHAGAALGDTDLYTVPKSVRKRAQELHDRHTVIETALTQGRKALAHRRRKLEEAEKRLSKLPPVEDAGPLRAIVDAVPRDLLTQMAAADEKVKRIRGAVERILLELNLPEQHTGAMTVPTRSQVDDHIDAHKDLRREGRDLAKQKKTLTAELENKRLNLSTLLNNDPPPTDNDLTTARSIRNDLWCEVRDGRHDRAGEFESALDRADHIADQMRRETARIADCYRLELEIDHDTKMLATLDDERADLDHRAEQLEAEWGRLWEGFPGPLPKPGSATSTLDGVKKLRESLDELGDDQARLSSLREHAASHVARLREALRHPEGVPSLGAENALAELPELRELAENRLAMREETARTRSGYEEQVLTAGDELTEAETQVTDHERDREAWATEWHKLLVQAKLPTGQDTFGALADLDRLDQVAVRVTEAAKNERESEQATITIDRFHSLLAATASACGRPTPSDETERHQLVGNLSTEAKANRSAADRRAGLRTEQDTLRAEAHDLDQTVSGMKAELAELCEKSGVDDVETLSGAVRRSELRSTLEMSLEEVVATLPADAETLLAEISIADEDQLHARLSGLTDRVTDLDGRRTGQSALFGEKKTELARLDGSAAATQAAANMETIVAALLEESEEYFRLQIARSIVVACMEEYRQSQQDPVLARASHLFGHLTLGGFGGLELDDEVVSPVVLARRGSDLMTVDQLSEGTRDQLYLALRLASLERYAEEERTLPFIIDDIFMTFDDQRARAALEVLNEMADRFQMITFTHHDHLAELARTRLPNGRVHIHRLPRFAATTT